MMLVLTSGNQAALEHAVETAFQLLRSQSGAYLPESCRVFNLGDFNTTYPDICVKYSHMNVQSEFAMLRYLNTLANEDGHAAPHVPRPLHYFPSVQRGWKFLVMERIVTHDVPESELLAKAVEAVKWLRSKAPPPGTALGSIGDEFIRHMVFMEKISPVPFKSVHGLETFLNLAVRYVAAWKTYYPPSDITLVNDKVVLTQSYMKPNHFGVAMDGRPVIFDAGYIQVLPDTLAKFTLIQENNFSIAASKQIMDEDERTVFSDSPNVQSLRTVTRLLSMASDDALGFDENGFNAELDLMLT